MSVLHRRISHVGTNHARSMGHYHPWGTEAVPMVMPMVRVTVGSAHIAVDQMEPLYAAGAGSADPIPATAPGQWGQLVAAGRP